MIKIAFACPYCGKKLGALESSAGKEKTCPNCRAKVRVPSPEAAAAKATSGSETKLLSLPRMRGMTLSLDRRYLVYYVSFEPETEKNGLWLLDLQSAKPTPQKLPFFGSYRWRDNERLIYTPFDPQTTEHNFYEYNVLTSQSRALFPGGTGLTIANGDWRVSPDGRKIVLIVANGAELNGIWVLDLDKSL